MSFGEFDTFFLTSFRETIILEVEDLEFTKNALFDQTISYKNDFIFRKSNKKYIKIHNYCFVSFEINLVLSFI